jgi:hypothetical protein
MTMTTLGWLGVAAYAMHILEEYTLDWRGWSRAVLGLPTEWNDFYVTNCVVVALGIAHAMLAPTLPLAVLAVVFRLGSLRPFFFSCPSASQLSGLPGKVELPASARSTSVSSSAQLRSHSPSACSS